MVIEGCFTRLMVECLETGHKKHLFATQSTKLTVKLGNGERLIEERALCADLDFI